MPLSLGDAMRVAAAVSLCLVSLGCSDGGSVDGKYSLRGTVKYASAPVEQGTIEISSPDRALGTGSQIENGEFSIEPERGLPPGVYQVRISSAKGGVAPDADAPPGPEASRVTAVEAIPPRYNVRSALTLEVRPDAEKNAYTFDLK